MISILVVDDDQYKSDRIANLCERILDGYGVAVTRAINVRDGIHALKRVQFDLLILDLNLPMREGAPPKPDGGLQVLHQVSQRRPEIHVPSHVVGLSGFGDLLISQSAQFAKHGWVLVKYSAAEQSWEEILANRLLHLATLDSDDDAYKTDLAIITALHSVELEQILELPADWKEHREGQDYTVYYRGRFQAAAAGGRPLDVVAASSLEMGMAASCALATKMIYEFRPRFMCMAGIAASASNAASFGDVLIATSAYDYGAGKNTVTRAGKGVFQPAPDPISVHQWVKARLEVFRMGARTSSFLTEGWTGKRPTKPPRLRPGPVASGAAVIADRNIVRRLTRQNRKVVGVEMEVFGVFMAAKVVPAPAPQVFAMKSVCDFAGKKKDDRYQLYAAHTSARCIYEFARHFLHLA